MLQLFQTIILLLTLFCTFLLLLGVVGLFGALTKLIHFAPGEIPKLVIFNIGLLVAIVAFRWLLKKIAHYRLGHR